MIRIEVHGVPAPQGSKTRMPNGAMLEGGSATGRLKQKNWRADVRSAAEAWREANGNPPLIDAPVSLFVTFRMPRPKSRKRDLWVATKPDLSKLLRCTEDSLTGVIWRDDSLVASALIAKRYVDAHELPGADIEIGHL